MRSARTNYRQAENALTDAINETKRTISIYEKAVATIKDLQHEKSDLEEKVEELREVEEQIELEMDLKDALRPIDDLAVSSKV